MELMELFINTLISSFWNHSTIYFSSDAEFKINKLKETHEYKYDYEFTYAFISMLIK